MGLSKKVSIWWGPPKKFTTDQQERRISWLELFYDLVYVIAIARLAHHVSQHMNCEGFLEFISIFTLIFWGWLNGSLHHDLHGNQGLRTRLMMLWQMLIIAALAITLGKTLKDYSQITVIIMGMQFFITYQWWSVGLYDKEHRKYSRPYIILFLVSFCLMGLSLFLSDYWLQFLLPAILLCNYMPPFIANRFLLRSSKHLNLSSSMFERLGLFTIIIFGELVIGVINGVSEIEFLNFIDWVNFSLAIIVVFSLWWIFFTFVSTRKVQKGFDKASLLELLYIPALISLCITAACFQSFFTVNDTDTSLQNLLGYSIGAFLFCIVLIMQLLVYPVVFDTMKRAMRLSLLLTAMAFLILSLANIPLSVTYYLLVVEFILITEIAYLNYVYYSGLLKEGIDPSEV
ncbi:MAG TPA: low temperature requirement protein A [Flavobacterium sp.]|nr:low temperature requirement protein A [Flavobacterium sp.]